MNVNSTIKMRIGGMCLYMDAVARGDRDACNRYSCLLQDMRMHAPDEYIDTIAMRHASDAIAQVGVRSVNFAVRATLVGCKLLDMGTCSLPGFSDI